MRIRVCISGVQIIIHPIELMPYKYCERTVPNTLIFIPIPNLHNKFDNVSLWIFVGAL